ncbi:MAG TPA: LacI family DNA-binding transcriptional regulator [Arachnia sp.]|nr:LacI family DNA-binding transcriptional regulator [Arachnia sp.]HMT87275.1 LacI family DNA-binding transcriptional regulator [Arachnia sp.]
MSRPRGAGAGSRRNNRSAARVGLKEVAEASGVSLQTVSRVVRDLDGVASETRARVLESLRELNYRPNLAARSLSASRTGSVHVINAVPLFHGYAATFLSICKTLQDMNLHVSTSVVPDGKIPDLGDLVPVSADGVIVLGGRREPAPWVGELAKRTPTVLVGRLHLLPDNVSGIAMDHALGARVAVEHLRERGARHILHIAGPLDWTDSYLRLESYLEVCAEAGMEPVVRYADAWDASAAAAALEDLPPETDAIFAVNDMLALGCLSILHHRGIPVPGRIKVIGFDDIPGAESFYPPLTTIRQGFAEVGERAVEQLKELMDGGEPRRALVEPTLVIREST